MQFTLLLHIKLLVWSTLIKSGITVSFPVRAQSMRHNLIFADPSKVIYRHQNDVNQC